MKILIVALLIPFVALADPNRMDQRVANQLLKNAVEISTEIGLVNEVVSEAQHCIWQAAQHTACSDTFETDNGSLGDNSTMCNETLNFDQFSIQTASACMREVTFCHSNFGATNPTCARTANYCRQGQARNRVNSFCSEIQSVCQTRFPARMVETATGYEAQACLQPGEGFADGGQPCRAGMATLPARTGNQNLRKQVLDETKRVFDQMKNPQGDFANRCCGHLTGTEQASCRADLSETSLSVAHRSDLGALADTPGVLEYYQGLGQAVHQRERGNARNITSTILLTEDYLMRHMQSGSLLNVLTHEMTHVCQISMHEHEGPDVMDELLYGPTTANREAYIDRLKADVSRVAGSNFTQCMEQQIRQFTSVNPTEMAGIDQISWWKEILGESGMAEMKTGPAAWEMTCHDPSDNGGVSQTHPPRQLTTFCTLQAQNQRVRQAMGCSD